MKENELNYPHLRFYMVNTKEIPMSIMSRETYDELNSYEPMMYRPQNWEKFHRNQIEKMEFFKNQLEETGYIPQVQKIAVFDQQDFFRKKVKIESEDGFVKWFG